MIARGEQRFDKRYAAGVLAENAFTEAGNGLAEEPDHWRRQQFVAPGAPRAGWIGVRLRRGG